MMSFVALPKGAKFAIIGLLIVLVALLQLQYDNATPRITFPAGSGSASPALVRLVDMGFHSTVASFLWVGTMPEIIDLFRKKLEYPGDVAFVNAVDPKLSYPYAFSVITLPAVPASAYPEAVAQAMAIGSRGLAQSDPDWRIPYYMAMNYYLELKDKKSALIYFDMAARTPGVPDFARRFGLNFGIGGNDRDTTIRLWETIRDSTNDDFTKERAQAFIDRLNLFNYLEAAAKEYHKRFGVYPATPQALVDKKVIPSVPQDPFGYTLILNADGTAGIDVNSVPAATQAGQSQ